MGVCFTRICFRRSTREKYETNTNNNSASSKVIASWDNRPTLDPTDFCFRRLTGDSHVKVPASINGQCEFVIEECENTSLYILDWTQQVTVDQCKKCTIVIGPVVGSVFIRDCSDCTFLILCAQFRARDCRNCNIQIMCATQPIIESSIGMTFSCLQLQFDGLDEQIRKANLNVQNNQWFDVFDYTKADGNLEYSEDANCFTNKTISKYQSQTSKSVIPRTIRRSNAF